MPDNTEVELKFGLSPQAAERVQSEMLAGAQTRDLQSTYYDTPHDDLHRAGATIRLRRSGDTSVQTLKSGTAGAVSRFEDERAAPHGILEPKLFPKRALHAAGLRKRALRPIFETRVTRRTAEIRPENATIEVALDQGCITAGDAQTPIRELELELKSGEVSALFAAARGLLDQGGVTLSLTSKAERGYRLRDGALLQAVKFNAPTLDFRAPDHAGFQTLALAALHQLTANADILRQTRSIDALHQARVALRHLKTFVAAFKHRVSDAHAPAMRSAMDRLLAIFEDARALDVFESEAFLPLAKHEGGTVGLGHALLDIRGRLYHQVQDRMSTAEFARDIFDLAEWILCGPWLATLAPADTQTLKAAARHILKKNWKKLQRRGRRLDWLDARATHTFRIQAKKLRYLADTLGAPFHTKPLIKHLETLQTHLGALHDIATAPETVRLALADASPDIAFAAGAIIGERRADAPAHIEAAQEAFRALRRQSLRV